MIGRVNLEINVHMSKQGKAKQGKVRYNLVLDRQFTIIRGDSGVGKTHIVRTVDTYIAKGEKSKITIPSKIPVVRLTSGLDEGWEVLLRKINAREEDCIVVIDEDEAFVASKDFAELALGSNNYFVISTRDPLDCIPYGVKAIYDLKSYEKYNNVRQAYTETVLTERYKDTLVDIKPQLIITEDTHSGFQFFKRVFDCECKSAGGKTKIDDTILENVFEYENILVIVDGVGYGQEVEDTLDLATKFAHLGRNIVLVAPESFEYLLLRAFLDRLEIQGSEVLEPYNHCKTTIYPNWEVYFEKILSKATTDSKYLRYTKSRLSEGYFTKDSVSRIMKELPDINNSTLKQEYQDQ